MGTLTITQTRPAYEPGGLDATRQYLREISRIPLLDAAQEAALGKRIRNGDRAAVDELVVHNLRFVAMLARRYERHGVPLEDLIDEGNIGLIGAAQRFDERRGSRFLAYAVFWVRRMMLRYLDQKSRLVRVPVNKRRQLSRLARAGERLPHVLGREPTVHEIARSMGVTPGRVECLRRMPTRAIHIDRPLSGDESPLDGDVLEDARAAAFQSRIENDSDRARLEACLERLDRRGADIVRRYFGLHGGEPETLECIGRRYGITRERARQLRDRTLEGLRALLEHTRAA